VIFFPETFKALQQLQKCFLLFIVTNQSGIAKGAVTREDVNYINSHVITTLAQAGVKICDLYVCPHDRSDKCRCIKPKPYFLRKTSKMYGINLNASFTVGDHPHDVELARNVGAKGIYVLTGHGRKHLNELPKDTEIVSGMAETAELIMAYHAAGMRMPGCKQKEAKFVLDLKIAHDLWWRADLGHAPRDTRHVAQVLREAGIKVHHVSGGWLECGPRPLGIFEALTGKLAPADWVTHFNCPPEQPGRVLIRLLEKGVPVCDPGFSLLGNNIQGATE
jgi:histidinol-phosphate phosphatase family protein